MTVQLVIYHWNHDFRPKRWPQGGSVVILFNTTPPPQSSDHMISSLWLGSRRRPIRQHAMTAQTKPSGHATYVTSVFLSTTHGDTAYNEARRFEWGVKWRVLDLYDNERWHTANCSHQQFSRCLCESVWCPQSDGHWLDTSRTKYMQLELPTKRDCFFNSII